MQSKPPEVFYVVKISNDLTTTDQYNYIPRKNNNVKFYLYEFFEIIVRMYSYKLHIYTYFSMTSPSKLHIMQSKQGLNMNMW